jgi:protein transport protein SEC24
MAAPHGGYPPPGADPYAQGGPASYDGSQVPGYDNTASAMPGAAPEQSIYGAPHAGGKKKRAYAGQAFEFGSGANAALGGQNAGLGGYPGAPPVMQGGYPVQPQAPGFQPAGFGVDPGFQQLEPMPPQYVGAPGFQPVDQGYPAQVPTPVMAGAGGVGGVGAVTNQLGQMNLGAPQAAPLQQPAFRAQALNQLYPTDLISQPFQVSELDLPPPPIILPPNVGFCARS